MAAALHYDPSYISKIRAGKRVPSNQALFVESICSYITKNCCSEEERRKIASLTGIRLKNWKSGKTVFRPFKTGCVLQSLKKTIMFPVF